MSSTQERSTAGHIAQIVLDAAAVDGQLAQQALLLKLSQTPIGRNIVLWANMNPIGFEALIRLLSAAVRSYVRKAQTGGMLKEALTDQLLSLPFAVRQVVLSASMEAHDTSYTAIGRAVVDFDSVDESIHEVCKSLYEVYNSMLGVFVVVGQKIDDYTELSHEEKLSTLHCFVSSFTDTELDFLEQAESKLGRSLSIIEMVRFNLVVKGVKNNMQRYYDRQFFSRAIADPKSIIPLELSSDQLESMTSGIELILRDRKIDEDNIPVLIGEFRDWIYEILSINGSGAQGKIFYAILFPFLVYIEEVSARH